MTSIKQTFVRWWHDPLRPERSRKRMPHRDLSKSEIVTSSKIDVLPAFSFICADCSKNADDSFVFEVERERKYVAITYILFLVGGLGGRGAEG